MTDARDFDAHEFESDGYGHGECRHCGKVKDLHGDIFVQVRLRERAQFIDEIEQIAHRRINNADPSIPAAERLEAKNQLLLLVTELRVEQRQLVEQSRNKREINYDF